MRLGLAHRDASLAPATADRSAPTGPASSHPADRPSFDFPRSSARCAHAPRSLHARTSYVGFAMFFPPHCVSYFFRYLVETKTGEPGDPHSPVAMCTQVQSSPRSSYACTEYTESFRPTIADMLNCAATGRPDRLVLWDDTKAPAHTDKPKSNDVTKTNPQLRLLHMTCLLESATGWTDNPRAACTRFLPRGWPVLAVFTASRNVKMGRTGTRTP